MQHLYFKITPAVKKDWIWKFSTKLFSYFIWNRCTTVQLVLTSEILNYDETKNIFAIKKVDDRFLQVNFSYNNQYMSDVDKAFNSLIHPRTIGLINSEIFEFEIDFKVNSDFVSFRSYVLPWKISIVLRASETKRKHIFWLPQDK